MPSTISDKTTNTPPSDEGKEASTYIFDLDGTLLNTLGDLAAATNYALRTHALPEHSVDDIRRFVGNGVQKLIERAVPGGHSNPLFEPVLNDFRAYYLAHSLDTTAPYPGILPMLSELRRRGCRTAVVSNKFQAATQELVDHFFHGLIDVAMGENEAAGIRRKPAPDMVFAAMRAMHAKADSAVYIGDSDVDIATAKAAGLRCVSVLWGFRDRDFLLSHGATLFATTPGDILTL